MKRKDWFILVVLSLSVIVASTNVMAGTGEGRIIEFTAHGVSGGAGNYAFLVETVQNRLACATYGNGRFVTNNKELMAVILAARLTNKRVTVGGTGQCDVWGDAETIWYAYVWD
jgi:predicted small secreted protein